MIDELATLTRHAEVLASQERALGETSSAQAISGFLVRARPVLAALQAGAASGVSRRELTMLHSLAVQHVARAEREMQGAQSTMHKGRRGRELA